MQNPVFTCQMCGHCCEGRGGIVLSPTDEENLCTALNMKQDDFRTQYTEMWNGKIQLRTGTDGYCVFFRSGKGCLVHDHKPKVCQAWPFFKGNLIDDISFEMSKEYCLGIDPHADHTTFFLEGIDSLYKNELFADDTGRSGNALFTQKQLEIIEKFLSQIRMDVLKRS